MAGQKGLLLADSEWIFQTFEVRVLQTPALSPDQPYCGTSDPQLFDSEIAICRGIPKRYQDMTLKRQNQHYRFISIPIGLGMRRIQFWDAIEDIFSIVAQT